MEPNDTKKPKITENRDYDENGEYDPGFSPEQRERMLKLFGEYMTDKLGKGSFPHSTLLGEYL